MNPAFKNRLKRTILLSFGAILIGAGIGYLQVKNETASVVSKGPGPQEVAGVEVGGPFVLEDQDEMRVTEKTYAHVYKLIYFGFTSCPEVCPTELQKITQMLYALEDTNPEVVDKIQPLFITVDPARDTVDVMKNYVKMFHPLFSGLTGTQAQIDQVTHEYRIYAKKVETPGMNGYMMDHSSFIYLMSPENTMVAIYRTEDSADFIANDIKSKIQ